MNNEYENLFLILKDSDLKKDVIKKYLHIDEDADELSIDNELVSFGLYLVRKVINQDYELNDVDGCFTSIVGTFNQDISQELRDLQFLVDDCITMTDKYEIINYLKENIKKLGFNNT